MWLANQPIYGRFLFASQLDKILKRRVRLKAQSFLISAGATVLTVIVLGSCSNSESLTSSETPLQTTGQTPNLPDPEASRPPVVFDGGHGAVERAEPLVRVPGDYIPPASIPTNRDAIAAEVESLEGANVYVGPPISGFSFSDSPEDVTWACDRGDFEVDNLADASDLPFELTYLPPSTAETRYAYVATCKSGEILLAFQDFGVGESGRTLAEFSVSYHGSDRVILDHFIDSRVKPLEINGAAGVIGEPGIYGSGGGAIYWPAGDGFMMIGTYELPMAEMIKIAEGAIVKLD